VPWATKKSPAATALQSNVLVINLFIYHPPTNLFLIFKAAGNNFHNQLHLSSKKTFAV
jgi:hypothetical protein